jgi:hypothetical protein
MQHVTHIPRIICAKTMDMKQASSLAQNRAGRWRQESLSACYSLGFHPEAMKILAGLDKDEPVPILDRELVYPSAELVAAVFPCLKRNKEQVEEQLAAGVFKTEQTGENFLELMEVLGGFFLQDAAIRLHEVF